MLTLRGKRSEIYNTIRDNPEIREIKIEIKPSKELFLRILNQTKVNKIFLSAGIYRTIPKRIANALLDSEIKIIIENNHVGRPEKYKKEQKQKVINMLKDGKSAKEIKNELGIPTTAIYYWKRNTKI